MSLYSYNFNLLPIPERSAFSLGDELTRARFPDFQNTDQLKEFIQRLFILKLSVPNVFLQIKICAGLFIAIILNDLLILGRRRYEKSLWVARLIRKNSGTIIVPNAALAFLVIEAGFVILLIAFMFMAIEYYDSRNQKPNNFILWILLIWFPAFLGIFMSMVGCHFTTPTTKSIQIQTLEEELQERENSHGDRKSKNKHLIDNAIFINLIIIIIPILVLLSVFIPTIIGNVQYTKALQLQYEWQDNYKNQQEFTQEMVLEAQKIWYMILNSTYLAAIVFCIWFFWAIFCFLSFTFCASRLLLTIYKEYRRAEIDGPTFVVTNTEYSRVNINQIIADALRDQKEQQETRMNEIIDEIHLARFDNFDQSDTILTSCLDSEISLNHQEPLTKPLRTMKSRLSFLKRTKESEMIPTISCQQHKSFSERIKETLPGLIVTPQMEVEKAKQEMKVSQTDRKKLLKTAGLMMCINLCLHSPACAIFSSIALFMALTIYGSFEQPTFGSDRYGNMFEYFGSIALLFVVYSTLIIGLGGSFALLMRAYEPIFSSLPSFMNNNNKSLTNNDKKNDDVMENDQETFAETSTTSNQPETPKIDWKDRKIQYHRPTNSTFFETQSKPQF